MKNEKIMIISIITGVLVLLISVAYALYNYGLFGTRNNQLVLGDIYMHYKENNQLVLTDDDIVNANKLSYTKSIMSYQVNPAMANQEVADNELNRCVEYLSSAGMPTANGTMIDFCQGTGTAINGYTFQENLDNGDWFPEEIVQEMISLNIVIENEIEYTKLELNPVIKNQIIIENELSRCINYLSSIGYSNSLDAGSTMITYCQGEGTAYGGYSFQDDINDNVFDDSQIQEMLSLNVIVENGESYIVNPTMQTQIIEENELLKCIEVVGNMDIQLDEGSTFETYCKGTGTSNGVSFVDAINDLSDEEKKILLNKKIIIPVIEDAPYFEFTISGKNTYSNKDIYYDIILNHGDSHETRTERIRDDLLRFSLVKIVNGEETIMFENMSYDNLNNKNILRETIAKNTMDEVNITYRLYMGFYEGIRVGVIGPNSNQTVDYDFDTWNNEVYGSIKVNVKGGLVD